MPKFNHVVLLSKLNQGFVVPKPYQSDQNSKIITEKRRKTEQLLGYERQSPGCRFWTQPTKPHVEWISLIEKRDNLLSHSVGQHLTWMNGACLPYETPTAPWPFAFLIVTQTSFECATWNKCRHLLIPPSLLLHTAGAFQISSGVQQLFPPWFPVDANHLQNLSSSNLSLNFHIPISTYL